jgi:hypothetical protein
MDTSGRKLLLGVLIVIVAVAIGSAGFMMGYANGVNVAAVPAARAPTSVPQPTNVAPPTDSAQPTGAATIQAPAVLSSTVAPANEDQDFQVFWEAWQTLRAEYYGNDLPDS